MSQKMLALLYVMPTSLRECVPLLHSALCDLVLGVRILDGAVYSMNTCKDMHIEAGSHCLRKSEIEIAGKYIIEGLSKLEGCLPVCIIHSVCIHVSSACVSFTLFACLISLHTCTPHTHTRAGESLGSSFAPDDALCTAGAAVHTEPAAACSRLANRKWQHTQPT